MSGSQHGPIGIVRLERIYRDGDRLFSQSSIINWFRAIGEQAERVSLLVPVQRTRSQRRADGCGNNWLRLRERDRLFAVPNAAGFLRVLALSPLFLIQLTRMRLSCRSVLCRIPEHGSFILLPMVWVLGFSPTLWLVANRREIRTASLARRRGLKVRLGNVLGDLNGIVEAFFLRRWRVVANGSELAEYATRLRGDSGDVLQITSTTLRQADIPDTSPRERSVPRDGVPLRCLYVGRVAPDKGLDTLVMALGLASQALEAGTLVLDIVGWAAHGEKERLEVELRARGLETLVRFHGLREYGEPLFDCYRSADIFVLPSPSEGTPRVLVEAAAFGLPIVATAVGGVPDIISDGESGLLVPPGDPHAMAAALQRLVRDPMLRARMSRFNHARRRELSVEVLAARMLKFIAAGTM